jgi:GxxExxY protein
MTENDISYKIRGCIFTVFNTLGPGLFETAYQKALSYELQKQGLRTKEQVAVPIIYDGQQLDAGFMIDILVEDKVMIEIKSIAELADVHHKQVITYLKLTGLKLGLLINFNMARIEDGIFRKVNGL